MKALVRGNSKDKRFKTLSADGQARIVVQRLRQVIGALKYMQEKDVAAIFAKEKNRIGEMIGYIDKELGKTPRLYTPRGKEEVSYAPWKEQGLGKKWDKYMDDVFEKAKKKATDFMKLHLDDLDKEWDSQKKKDEYKKDPKDDQKKKDEKKVLEKTHKDMLDSLSKTRKEWDKVKNWEKPANWAQKSTDITQVGNTK
jgi:hypothetical protein